VCARAREREREREEGGEGEKGIAKKSDWRGKCVPTHDRPGMKGVPEGVVEE